MSTGNPKYVESEAARLGKRGVSRRRSVPRAAKEIDESRRLLSLFEEVIANGDRTGPWNHAELARYLGRPPSHGVFVGQCVSRIDAACFAAKLPALSLGWVVNANQKMNPEASKGPLWGPVALQLAENSRKHVWTRKDFDRVKVAFNKLPEFSARTYWKGIEQSLGQKAVEDALSHV
jgi:hypothetical protein